MTEQDKAGRKNSPGPLRLWILLSGFWTVATLLRVDRVWVPLIGWRRVLEGPWIWISLIVPPLMFAVPLIVLHMLRRARDPAP